MHDLRRHRPQARAANRAPILHGLMLLCAAVRLGAQDSVPSRDAALASIRERNWPAAAVAFEALVRANPFDPMHHFYLGAAQLRAGTCPDGVPSLERAFALGVNGGRSGMRQVLVDLARCATRAGRGDSAVALLTMAWRDWGLRDLRPLLADSALETIARDPRLLTIAGVPADTTGWDRAARWRFDLAYLARLITETHPMPFHTTPERPWRAAVDSLASTIPTMTDRDVILTMMRLVARIGDGHTALYPPTDGPSAWRLLPIWPLALSDGWYVAAAAPPYRALVGTRLEAAGAVPFDTVVAEAGRLLARDNDRTVLWLGQIPLQAFDLYAAIGAADSSTVTFTGRALDGATRQVTVRAGPIDRDPNARWAPADWPHMASSAPPAWLEGAAEPWAIRWLPEERMLYVQLNQVANADEMTLAAFGESVRAELEARGAGRLVLDVRLNNGGNGNLAWGFLAPWISWPAFREPNHLFVLIGPRSFSATGFLLGELEQKTNAVLIGWPTGVRPVGWSTEVPFHLPFSGLSGSISARLEVKGLSADDRRPWWSPAIVAWPTGADLAAGHDPVMDAVRRLVAGTR